MTGVGAWPSLKRAVARACADFDEAVSGLPLVGSLLAPRWRILRVDHETLALGVASSPPRVRERRPVVARLTPELGARIELQLPMAAVTDLMSAADLALDTASPLSRSHAWRAIDVSSLEHVDGSLRIAAEVADADAARAAGALARSLTGRLDAMDVERSDLPDGRPRIDLRTGGVAMRPGLTPSRMLAAVYAVALLTGALGLGAAAWRERLDAFATAGQHANAAERAATLIAAERRKYPPVIETVDALSTALPGSAYLEMIEISGPNIRLAGRGTGIAELPGAINANPRLAGAAFSGATRSLESGLQAFEIAATRKGEASP